MGFDTFDVELVSEYFDAIASRFQRKNRLSPDDLDYTFKHAIETFGIPYPDTVLYRYFLNRSVIASLLLQIHNDDRLSREDRNKLNKNTFNIIFKKLRPWESPYFIQYRVLGHQGTYPNINLTRGACWYTNHNQTPTLITKNNACAEEVFSGSSEVQLLTRNELKMAVCISCAAHSGMIYLYFPGHNQFRISESALKKVPQELKLPFLHELVAIHRRFPTVSWLTGNSTEMGALERHNFVDFQKYLADFVKLFDGFSIRNHLLMRTGFYLIKSVMLWVNWNFSEEAIANVFFSLEGCLHLIQEKHGVHQAGLDLNNLRDIFIGNFENGEGLFESIQEAYEKRIAIVHAKPFGTPEWSPFLMADDFYEYFDLVKVLINYVITDRKV